MEIKDKPNSMSVREWITKKIATGIMIPEKIIRVVITHQFDTASDALNKYNSLEISGFGKFFYNTKKADREIEWCKEQKATYEEYIRKETSEIDRDKTRRKLGQVELKLARLTKKKLDSDGES